MGACTYPYERVVDAFVIEARAYERALLFAIDIGFRSILLEGDSLSIIKKLKLDREDRSVLRPISQSIQLLKSHFVEVSYHFVPKEANRAAHNLALEGRRCQTLASGLRRHQIQLKRWWTKTKLFGFNTTEKSLLSFEDGEGSEESSWLVFKTISFFRFSYTD
ncbi:hypothetical protein Goshw_022034 [Gossypium schwendimanii]|uniref:RNase H type-1 domain-containing protein n=1 Tax=Gossypium schwendimanii TaxID=34291 RepID=A0A7J9N6W4_GOSSC|nr:hypothetical protein [Gossypium schwendimanii]